MANFIHFWCVSSLFNHFTSFFLGDWFSHIWKLSSSLNKIQPIIVSLLLINSSHISGLWITFLKVAEESNAVSFKSSAGSWKCFSWNMQNAHRIDNIRSTSTTSWKPSVFPRDYIGHSSSKSSNKNLVHMNLFNNRK